MSVRKQEISALGWEIKRRLAERRQTQTQFCLEYGIPLSRLSEIISGVRLNRTYRTKIIAILGIEESA